MSSYHNRFVFMYFEHSFSFIFMVLGLVVFLSISFLYFAFILDAYSVVVVAVVFIIVVNISSFIFFPPKLASNLIWQVIQLTLAKGACIKLNLATSKTLQQHALN